MEYIKKKICLEDFISRIPALIETVDVEDVIESASDGSWGKIPRPVSILGKAMKYGTLMDLYYPLLKIVMNSNVLEYDASGQKWRQIDYDWRDIVNKMYEPGKRVRFVSEIPTEQLSDRMKISVVTEEERYSFNDNVVNVFGGENDGLNVIEEVHRLIGKKVTPSDFTGMYVPYFIYLADVPDIIAFMEDLKVEENCCDKKRYEEYGGDDFLEYLRNLTIPNVTPGVSDSVIPFSLDIPILLTSDLTDLGMFRMYDVEEVIENDDNTTNSPYLGNTIGGYVVDESGEPLIGVYVVLKGTTIGAVTGSDGEYALDLRNASNNNSGVLVFSYIGYKTKEIAIKGRNVINARLIEDLPDEVTDSVSKTVVTSGESKLRTLRKRKISMDDNGIALPGLYTSGYTRLDLPYQVGYVKNIQIKNGMFYGDVIESMTEIFAPSETTPEGYDSMKTKAVIDKVGAETAGYKEGTENSPISGIDKTSTSPGVITYSSKSESQVDAYADSDIRMRRDGLVTELCNLLKTEYPDYYCYKQDYNFKYDLVYEEEDENGNIITKRKSGPENGKGTVYIIFDDPQMKIDYVLGGLLREDQFYGVTLDEDTPFRYSGTSLDDWNGAGIWYSETYPLKKLCVGEYTINGTTTQYTYDEIDFASQEMTYTYDGIDFPRKNYILCNDIRYKSESHRSYSTSNPIFRDEKMMGLTEPLKESYDVVIDRGASAAFEKHLQLSELKTWADLENYRNGMFLNK